MVRARPVGALAVILLLPLPACGKRGDPLPPLRKTPAPVLGLKVAQRGDQLEVTYQAPGASTDGVRLPELQMELLVAQGEGDFEKLATRRRRKAQPGERLAELVPAPPAGTAVRMAVRALARKSTSVRTPVAGLVAQAPPVGPRALTAELVATGVALAWKGTRPDPVKAALPTPTPLAGPPGSTGTRPSLPGVAPSSPSGAPPPASPVVPSVAPPAAGTSPAPAVSAAAAAAPPFPGGFSVYRRASDGVYTVPIAPPTDTKSFVDTTAPLGQSVCYVVRGVASLEPLVESASSEEACLAVADVASPGTPTGLSILAVEGGIELSWSPLPEADLAGYRILRSAPAGAAEPIAEVAPNQTQFLDKSVVPGVRYRYRLVAFDQAGNPSAPSEPAEGELR